MHTVDIEDFKNYLRDQLESCPVVEPLSQMIRARTSSAGTRAEEVFTREFLSPCIADFFYRHVRDDLDMSDDAISKGLGAEGYENRRGFGFTPASSRKHLFTKDEFIKPQPPKTWIRSESKKLSLFQACPDFAVREPLPLSILGEVKYFKSASSSSAIRELFVAARQAVFYLAAFHGDYRSAMIVVADASPGHSFFKGLDLVRPELLRRFGADTDIHLVAIKLS